MRELSNIIRGEIKDPRINPMTSVVAVEVAPDLKTAKAYISVLKSAEGYIRRTLAKNINLRNTPAITFIIDQSIEYGVEMACQRRKGRREKKHVRLRSWISEDSEN